MSVMEKILAQQKALQEREASFGGNQQRLLFFTPSNGDNKLRILPPWTLEDGAHFKDQFWREAGLHWNVNSSAKAPIICPRNTEHLSDQDIPCAICEFCDELAKDKSDLNAAKLLKQLRSRRVYMLPVIDLKDPEYTAKDVATCSGEDCPFEAGDPKVQIYSAGATVWTQLVSAMATNEESIADLKTGRDVTVERQYNKADPKKTKYVVSLSFKATKAEVPDGFQTPSIEDAGWLKSYADQLEFLAEGVGGDFPNLLPGAVSPSLPAGDSPEPEGDAPDEMDLNSQMQAALNE